MCSKKSQKAGGNKGNFQINQVIELVRMEDGHYCFRLVTTPVVKILESRSVDTRHCVYDWGVHHDRGDALNASKDAIRNRHQFAYYYNYADLYDRDVHDHVLAIDAYLRFHQLIILYAMANIAGMEYPEPLRPQHVKEIWRAALKRRPLLNLPALVRDATHFQRFRVPQQVVSCLNPLYNPFASMATKAYMSVRLEGEHAMCLGRPVRMAPHGPNAVVELRFTNECQLSGSIPSLLKEFSRHLQIPPDRHWFLDTSGDHDCLVGFSTQMVRLSGCGKYIPDGDEDNFCDEWTPVVDMLNSAMNWLSRAVTAVEFKKDTVTWNDHFKMYYPISGWLHRTNDRHNQVLLSLWLYWQFTGVIPSVFNRFIESLENTGASGNYAKLYSALRQSDRDWET